MADTARDVEPGPDYRLRTRGYELPDESIMMRRMMSASRFAIVGLSGNPSRPSRIVSRYLQQHGKQIVPVNPALTSVLGEKCFPSLAAIPEPPPVTVVFRRAEAAPDVIDEAIAAGVRGVWLQQGIVSHEAKQMALDHGLDYVEDRCIKVELMLYRR